LVKPHEAVAKVSDTLVTSDSRTSAKAELRIQDLEKHELESTETSLVTLSPPDAMFRPIEYPPLHIFVSIWMLGIVKSSYSLQQTWYDEGLNPGSNDLEPSALVPIYSAVHTLLVSVCGETDST